MNYTCDHCEAELDDETEPVMFIKFPARDPLVYCMDNVDCAESGADMACVEAREFEVHKKSDAPPKPNAEDESTGSE